VREKRIDIRWRDLDGLGHVNQAVYQTYAEEVIDDWFRHKLGLGEGEIWDYVAARVAIDYRNELRLTDGQVVGTARLVALGTASITLGLELRAADGRLAAELEAVLVVWDPAERRPRPLTADERERLRHEHESVTAP
jgi:acyl-CoA thioester hydrolase